MSPINVLVTGGTGKVGSQALRTLLPSRQIKVRALVRDAAKARWIEEAGGELVEGALEDDDAVRRAVRGVDTLVLITPAGAHAFEQAMQVITPAREAGVRKVVRLSAIKAAEDGPTDNTRQHGRTERAILESGMSYVFLRPNYYMQNLLGSLGSILGQGKLYAGVGDARVGVIDARDVGDSIAGAVLTDAFDGQALELSGPESITHAAIATAIGNAVGRTVEYVPVPPEAAGEALRQFGADEWYVQVIKDYSRAYSDGFGDFVTDAVKSLAGHPPRDIATFAREVLAPAAQSEGARQPAANATAAD